MQNVEDQITFYGITVPPKTFIILDEYGFALYDAFKILEAGPIARSQSSRKLSSWAFAHGALEVKFDFDLQYEK